MGIEVLVAVFGTALVFGMAGAAAVVFFFGQSIFKATIGTTAFPVSAPRWGTRMTSSPPFGASVDDVSVANDCLHDAAIAAGYDKDSVRRRLSALQVVWLKADPKYGRNRVVVDPWGREVHGWHLGDTLYVVYLDDDRLENTAYIHEACHEIHEVVGKVDYAHADQAMFGPDGIEKSAKSSFLERIKKTR